MIYKNDAVEKKAVFEVAGLMAAAARTAPKTKGVDNIVVLIVDGDEKDAITEEMRNISERYDSEMTKMSYARDAGCVDASDYLVLIGVRDNPAGLFPCGTCGFENCSAAVNAGARCAFNFSDLGTATASAVIVAAQNFIDNRIMNTAGKAAMEIDAFGEPVIRGYGIPVSARGKNIYFDRK